MDDAYCSFRKYGSGIRPINYRGELAMSIRNPVSNHQSTKLEKTTKTCVTLDSGKLIDANPLHNKLDSGIKTE